MLVCHDPVCCVAFFNVRHNCPYGTTGLGDMIFNSHFAQPLSKLVRVCQVCGYLSSPLFCVDNSLGDCQFNRLLKAVMEKFAVVFAKITQNPKVWTVHLDAIHERDISGLQLHDSCLLNSKAFKEYAVLKSMWKGVTCHE